MHDDADHAAQEQTKKGKRRWRSGVKAEREIRKLSKTTDTVFPGAPFERLVREIAQEVKSDVRFACDCMDAIHEAAEQFVTDRIVKADLARRHAGRKTLLVDDIHFAEYMTPNTSELVDNALFQKERKEIYQKAEVYHRCIFLMSCHDIQLLT